MCVYVYFIYTVSTIYTSDKISNIHRKILDSYVPYSHTDTHKHILTSRNEGRTYVTRMTCPSTVKEVGTPLSRRLSSHDEGLFVTVGFIGSMKKPYRVKIKTKPNEKRKYPKG